MKVEKFRVAGTSYRQEALEKLVWENEDYNLSKNQLGEDNFVDERVYEYCYSGKSTELVPEPDNEHDPNAIKVMVNGIHIGYIEAADTARVKELLDSGEIDSIRTEIEGGKYKYVTENDDGEYEMEKGETNLFADLKIYIPEDDASDDIKITIPKQEQKASQPEPKPMILKILMIVLAVMCLILALVYPIMVVASAFCIFLFIKWSKESKK